MTLDLEFVPCLVAPYYRPNRRVVDCPADVSGVETSQMAAEF